MLYKPGTAASIDFTVPSLTGANSSGLSWTINLVLKDGAKLTSGNTEYDSVAVSEDASNDFYILTWTPDGGSTSRYFIKIVSDASPADVFEENFEPDLAYLMLFANMEHNDVTSNPQEIVYKLPDGTVLATYAQTKTGTTVTRVLQ